MTSTLLRILGILVSVFVGSKFGGSSTGIAWGPATGAGRVQA